MVAAGGDDILDMAPRVVTGRTVVGQLIEPLGAKVGLTLVAFRGRETGLVGTPSTPVDETTGECGLAVVKLTVKAVAEVVESNTIPRSGAPPAIGAFPAFRNRWALARRPTQSKYPTERRIAT